MRGFASSWANKHPTAAGGLDTPGAGGHNQEMHWWEIAKEWEVTSGKVQHGQLRVLVDEFIKTRKIKPSTLRRYASALEFAERLMRDYPHLVDERVKSLPLDDIQALKRLSRFPDNDLASILPMVLSRSLSGARLLAMELEVRPRNPKSPSTNRDAHAIRLTSRPFKQAATSAYAALAASIGATLQPYDLPGPLEWLVVDLTMRDAEGRWHGIRLFPATSAAGEPDRVREAVVFGMAATRVLHSVTFVAQSKADASCLATAMQDAALPAVGVKWLDDAAGLQEERPPDLAGAPDLAVEWSDRVRSLSKGKAGEDEHVEGKETKRRMRRRTPPSSGT